MKNTSKKNLKSLLSGKFIYVAAAVALCAVIASAGITNYTERKLGQLLPQTEAYDESGITSPAEVNKTDVPDERAASAEETYESTQETVTQPQTEPKKEKTTAATTAKPTEYVPVNEGFILPCDGEVVKKFSSDQPVYSKTMSDWRIHEGLDFMVEEGEKICSVGNGKVTKVISDPMWGYVVEIDYGTFIGRYCSLKQGTGVSIDDIVSAGDIIGEIGTIPAESSDEPHLHFEVIKNEKKIDPMLVLPDLG
ncbi:MAG: M23 family metallopeptidase [Oscillospiraceae bacterium]|nr:M23 family metallopeptidase [Oscillospiraceae bacterium]